MANYKTVRATIETMRGEFTVADIAAQLIENFGCEDTLDQDNQIRWQLRGLKLNRRKLAGKNTYGYSWPSTQEKQ